jgi:predicted RNA-binding protein YlxR (DUF448 family)
MKNTAKKTPLRTCIVCRTEKAKTELFRIVKTPEGKIDTAVKANGRGAYVCKTEACVKKAQKEHRLEKALGCAVPAEVYESLEALCKQNGE